MKTLVSASKYSDIATGLNYKRQNWNKLIDDY